MVERSLYFPSDLVHCIVDYLEGDQDALSNCALVAWGFLHPSRKYIFGHVVLKASPEDRRPATRLLNLLSMAPHLTSYITSLRIVVAITNANIGQAGWIFDDDALPLVLAGLQHLREVSVESTTSPIKWAKLPTHLQDAFYELFTRSQLSKLSLIQVENFPIKVLRRCANLKHHVLRCVSLLVEETGPLDLLPDFGASLCLENLEMFESRDTFFNLNAWLRNPEMAGMNISSLKHLSLAIHGRSIRYTEDMFVMSRFLEHSSLSLEVLRLTPPIVCEYPPFIPHSLYLITLPQAQTSPT